MRTINEINDDTHQIEAQQRLIKATKAEKLAAYKLQLDGEFADEVSRLSQEWSQLSREAEAARAATVTSPLEGRRVARKVLHGSYVRSPNVTEHGVVVCVRSNADFPKIAESHRARQRLPDIGDVIVQRISAKGEKLPLWERLRLIDDSTPRGWTLV